MDTLSPLHPAPCTPASCSGDVSVTYIATYQTLTSNECDVCDVSFQLQSQVEKNDDKISVATPIAAENEISGSDASPCVTIESATGFQPPQPCVTPASHTSPTTEPLKVDNELLAETCDSSDPTDCSTWQPGTKFQSVSQHKSYRKYLGKVLTVKANDQQRRVIDAEETKDGFFYWCVQLANNSL
jgi:hypothetical protein